MSETAVNKCLGPGSSLPPIHEAHNGHCIFSLNKAQLKSCIFGRGNNDCSICKSWSSSERKAYRHELLAFEKLEPQPQCYSNLLRSVLKCPLAAFLSDSDSDSHQGDEEITRNAPATVTYTSPSGPSEGMSPRLASAPAFPSDPSMFAQWCQMMWTQISQPRNQSPVPSDTGPSTEESRGRQKLIIQMAQEYAPDLLASVPTPSAFPGSQYVWAKHLPETTRIRYDRAIYGAFLRGINIHRTIPNSAFLFSDVKEALLNSSYSVPNHKSEAFNLRISPTLAASIFSFEEEEQASYLSQDALKPEITQVHQDWGNLSESRPKSSLKWQHASRGLAFMLEAATTLDCLSASLSDTERDLKMPMISRIRELLASASQLFGASGHDALSSRRAQLLNSIAIPDKDSFLEEPFLPGKLLGDRTTKALQSGRDPVEKIASQIPKWLLHRHHQSNGNNNTSRGRFRDRGARWSFDKPMESRGAPRMAPSSSNQFSRGQSQRKRLAPSHPSEPKKKKSF